MAEDEEPGNDAPSLGVETFENPAGASEDLDRFAEIEEVDDGDVEEEKGNDAAAVVEDPAVYGDKNTGSTKTAVGVDVDEALRGVKLVHLPLDVDSYSLQVSDLATAIEQAWIDKLKTVFINVFGDEWDDSAGDGEDWHEIFDAQWATELEGGCLEEAPYRVLRFTKAGTELTGEDLQSLDDVQMIFVELQRGKKSVGLKMFGKTYTLNCVVERNKVNMFMVPLNMRVPTPKRLLADGDDETLEGGVSVLKICNWDVAIVWNKLEKDPEKADVWTALSKRIDARSKDADDDGEQAQDDIIVDLFNELMRAGVTELGSDDICDFMDKSVSSWGAPRPLHAFFWLWCIVPSKYGRNCCYSGLSRQTSKQSDGWQRVSGSEGRTHMNFPQLNTGRRHRTCSKSWRHLCCSWTRLIRF